MNAKMKMLSWILRLIVRAGVYMVYSVDPAYLGWNRHRLQSLPSRTRRWLAVLLLHTNTHTPHLLLSP